nr:zinc finger, CCHC-type [Tanacetum cinerariifolium]
NLLSLKVKIIRYDNGTEFKNADLNQLCGLKGIKREFSVLRTPQQNGITERKNRTLIKAARTLLADSLLPIPFWAEAFVSPDIHSSSCGDQTMKQGDKTENKDKGKSPAVTITGFWDLNEEFEECINNSSNGVNVAGFSIFAAGLNFTNNTNDFSAAGPSNAAMPNLEDLSHNADNVGAEADINNMESIISVSLIPTTRIYKDHPTSQIISDLSSTTQTKSMARAVRDQGGISHMFNEDFHTCMFSCFLSQKESKRVHQALKDPSWIEAMQEELLQFKMQKVWILVDLPYEKRAIVYQMDVKSAFLYGTIEEEVYVCQPLGFEDPEYPDKIYVDDIIFGATNKALCQSFEKLMKDKFQMSSMGELTFFLGLQVKQKKDGIFICQDKYVAEILRKFRLSEGKLASTPIDAEKPLLKDTDGEDVDVHTYRVVEPLLGYLIRKGKLWVKRVLIESLLDMLSIPRHIDDHTDDVPSEISKPRKGKRVQKAKSYGSYVQLYLVVGSRDQVGSQYSYCYRIEEDHRTYNEAMKSRDVAFWKEAIEDEIGFRQKEVIDYFDTYAPVARITTIRLLLALAVIHNLVIHQMDVKTAFLNGDLDEEVYMKQPEGFVMPGNEHKVCKLVKSLYGLKQAPKQWHQKFDEVLLSSGFHLNQSDKCVYRKFDNSDKGVIIFLYVDDMLIFGTNQNQVDKTKKFLSSRFSMKDMGEANVILGIKIKRENKGIVITQSHYIEKIFKKFNREDCSPVSTLMDPVEKLKPNIGKPVDQLEYSRAIG